MMISRTTQMGSRRAPALHQAQVCLFLIAVWTWNGCCQSVQAHVSIQWSTTSTTSLCHPAGNLCNDLSSLVDKHWLVFCSIYWKPMVSAVLE
eukprot:2553861-Karenia_brevis.AAC.1